MRQVTAIFVFVLVAFVATAAYAGVKTITSYGLGEFAIKGAVEAQLNGLTKDIERAKPKGESSFRVNVVGFADRTGSAPENDRVAQERAEQVKEFLLSHFPDARITVITRGDSENKRAVEVKYVFVTAAATKMIFPYEKEAVVFVILASALALIKAVKVKKTGKPGFKTISLRVLTAEAEIKYDVKLPMRGNGLLGNPIREAIAPSPENEVEKSIKSDLASYHRFLAGEKVGEMFVANKIPAKIEGAISSGIIVRTSTRARSIKQAVADGRS